MAIYDLENSFERVDYIFRALDLLRPVERSILALHFGIAHPAWSLTEIAQARGLSVTRIQQIKEKSLRKIRYAQKCGKLKGNPLRAYA